TWIKVDPETGRHFNYLTHIMREEFRYKHTMKAPSDFEDFFQVEGNHCFLCEEMESCMVFPLLAAYTTGAPGIRQLIGKQVERTPDAVSTVGSRQS
ncbi:MAG: hypothetical protein GY757_35810, partial [bacterium]|nr:hypothetical protein [bacterium]